MSDKTPLAAIVPKERGEIVLQTLQAEGVYDPTRQIREHNDGTLAIPITETPTVQVREVVQQVDPAYRERDLETLLRNRGWTEAELATAPASWAVIGTVILVTIPEGCPDETDVGEALLELHHDADTVLAREGITGPRREPARRHIAGVGDTETVHTEHGIQYALDLTEVMFSPGNKAERARMGAVVRDSGDRPAIQPDTVPDQLTTNEQASDERVFDMFAGIGYFTLPMALAGATVIATEINPTAFRYLIENAKLNKVGSRVLPYRADCRSVIVEPPVDRVIMGHYEAPEYLETALEALRPEGIIHMHTAVPEHRFPDRPQQRLTDAVTEANREIMTMQPRRVKTYSEGVLHAVVDIRVR